MFCPYQFAFLSQGEVDPSSACLSFARYAEPCEVETSKVLAGDRLAYEVFSFSLSG